MAGLKACTPHQSVRPDDAYWVRGETSSSTSSKSGCLRCSTLISLSASTHCSSAVAVPVSRYWADPCWPCASLGSLPGLGPRLPCHRCDAWMGQKLEDRWHIHTHTHNLPHTFNTPKGTEIYCATQMAIAAAHHAHGRVRAHTHTDTQWI